MSRQFFVGGNWKMNGSSSEVDKILTGLKGETADLLDANTGTLKMMYYHKHGD